MISFCRGNLGESFLALENRFPCLFSFFLGGGSKSFSFFIRVHCARMKPLLYKASYISAETRPLLQRRKKRKKKAAPPKIEIYSLVWAEERHPPPPSPLPGRNFSPDKIRLLGEKTLVPLHSTQALSCVDEMRTLGPLW